MLEILEDLENTSTSVELRKVDRRQNIHRFYRMSLQADLFGKISLLREWGRIGCCGRMLVDTHEEREEAAIALAEIAAAKRRRGYRDCWCRLSSTQLADQTP